MEIINRIDELHSLIINSNDRHQTFINHLDLWKEFYSDYNSIIRRNLLNPKLFDIIEFLLEQENGEIFDYFHSNIISAVNREQQQLTYTLGNAKPKRKEDIDKLLDNLEHHNRLANFLDTINFEDVFGDIKKFKSKNVEIDTIDHMVIILYECFFEMEPQVVKKLVDFISKKIITFQKDETRNYIMNRDLIFQYLTKIIPIKKFVGEDIEDDELLKQVKNHQIKDTKLLGKVFNKLSIETIFELFGSDLNNILDFVSKADYLDEQEKFIVICNYFDKLLEKEYYLLFLELIINNNENPAWKLYLDGEIYNKIIIGSLNQPVFQMTSDMIKYLLKCDLDFSDDKFKDLLSKFQISKTDFEHQCMYLLRKKDFLKTKSNFDIEDIEKTLFGLVPEEFPEDELTIKLDDKFRNIEKTIANRVSMGLDIDFDMALHLLNIQFKGQNRLSYLSVQAIIRSIATNFEEILGIENNGFYYYDVKKTYGTFYPHYQAISINRNLIYNFLNFNIPILTRFEIFITMFHEIKHAKLKQNRKDNNWDIDTYDMLKENVMRSYDENFYSENYHNVKEEISARINGNSAFMKFVETFFPYLLDKIQDMIIIELEKEKKLENEQNSDRIMTLFGKQQVEFNRAFDALIRYNPNILEENPILKLEYHPNGIPKSAEEIYLGRTEENKKLIDEIIKKRYPEPNPHERQK